MNKNNNKSSGIYRLKKICFTEIAKKYWYLSSFLVKYKNKYGSYI